jgi:hypothetical protein
MRARHLLKGGAASTASSKCPLVVVGIGPMVAGQTMRACQLLEKAATAAALLPLTLVVVSLGPEVGNQAMWANEMLERIGAAKTGLAAALAVVAIRPHIDMVAGCIGADELVEGLTARGLRTIYGLAKAVVASWEPQGLMTAGAYQVVESPGAILTRNHGT